jgi:hypothetical protein
MYYFQWFKQIFAGGGTAGGGDGVTVRVGCSVIYRGNTMRTIGSTIDGCKTLGYLGNMGFSVYCFSFFLFIAPL